MKISVELALKQSLSLTHDMRLAIDMLAMSAMEIEAIIDEELLKNPYLEETDSYERAGEIAGHREESQSAFDVALSTTSATVDFRDELLQQIGENFVNQFERDIAQYLVHHLDDNGLLLDHHDVYRFIAEDLGVFPEWIELIRKRVMDLEPLGCGALDSSEALIHQAKKLCCFPHPEFLSLVKMLALKPEQKLTMSLLQRMKADDAIFELHKLKPRPSMGFVEKNALVPEAIPEVIVKQGNDGFWASLTRKPSERLVVIGHTEQRGKQNTFIRESRKRALFMMRALEYRETSLAKVTNAIVEHQQAWLGDTGPLKPLNLRDIADHCGIHESSVSRLTKGKYLSCDKGVYELKYFFSSRIQHDGDDEGQSANAVKSQIKNIISKENKREPLSDQKILESLKDKGFTISRRTVAKYRESLDLKPAHLRRALTVRDGACMQVRTSRS